MLVLPSAHNLLLSASPLIRLHRGTGPNVLCKSYTCVVVHQNVWQDLLFPVAVVTGTNYTVIL